MKEKIISVRYRMNSNGIAWFNPTTRKWVDCTDDASDLVRMICNVTKNYPQQRGAKPVTLSAAA